MSVLSVFTLSLSLDKDTFILSLWHPFLLLCLQFCGNALVVQRSKVLALGKRPSSRLCPPLLWNDSPQKQTTEVNLAEAKSTFCCRVSWLSIQIRDGQDARAHRSVSVRTELDGSCVPIWHCPSVPCQRGTGENAYSVGGGHPAIRLVTLLVWVYALCQGLSLPQHYQVVLAEQLVFYFCKIVH